VSPALAVRDLGILAEMVTDGLSNAKKGRTMCPFGHPGRNQTVLEKGGPLAFESEETVLGCVRQSEERIEYRGILRVQESALNPVSLELEFVPPHPYLENMPMRLSIRARSVTEAYSKLVRVLDEHGVDLDT
jgi:hypothetical protein